MTFLEIMALIKGVLAFPQQILALVKLIQGTPEANREAMLAKLHDEALNFQATGRPTWDN